MESVGHTLREARLRLDLTLEQVSADTRISLKNLTAIEADELLRISSPFFYRSFVRQFAAKVKLDYNCIAEAVQQAASTMPEPLMPGQQELQLIHVPRIKHKRAPNLRWLSSVASFCLVMAACTGLYTMWQQSHSSWHAVVAQLSDRLSDLKQSASSFSAAAKSGEPESSSVPAAKDDNPAPKPRASLEQKPPANSDENSPAASNEESAAAAPLSSSAPAAPASEPVDPGIRIELAALEPSWLSVVADGKEIFSGVLDASETKVLEGQESARIRTGNAGGLSFTFNGKDLGVLGPRGQVRTVIFTRENYKVLRSAPQVALATFIRSGE
jgi:cytoskeletal protein RodZ